MATRVNEIEVRLPSGSEVGSAAFHPRVAGCCETHEGQAGWKSKLNGLRSRSVTRISEWKERGVAKTTGLRRAASERAGSLKYSAQETMRRTQTTVRDRTRTGVARMNGSMRDNPMKWAGIAAGSGVALGLIGRWMEHQRHRRHLPQVVVIEAAP